MITSAVEYYNRNRRAPQVSTITVYFTNTAASLRNSITVDQYFVAIYDEFIRVLQTEVFRPYHLSMEQQENLQVFLVMENGGAYQTAYDENTLVNVLTIENMMDMVGRAQQSNADVDPYDTTWSLTIDSNFYSRGRGGPISPKYKNVFWKSTHEVHSDEQGVVNCAAYALNYAMRAYNNKNRPSVQKKIVDDARNLQTQLGWGESVHQSQLQDFVDAYPEYRVTVLNSSGLVRTFTDTTFTGAQYENLRNPTKAIYLGCMDDHWYAIKSPAEYFRAEGYSSVFCHRCVYRYHGSYTHICENPNTLYKRPRTTYLCELCGQYSQRKTCHCQMSNCPTCSMAIKTGSHKRCLVTKPSDIPQSQQQFSDGSDRKYAALWVYDLESCMETVEVETDQISHFNEHGIPVQSKNVDMHKPNLAIAKNVVTGEMKEWYGARSITEMVQFMMQYNSGNNILVAHNSSGYDARLVYEEITKNIVGIEITTVYRGSKVITMNAHHKGSTRYGSSKLVFRDSMLHLPGSLAGLAKAFCRGRMIKGYFPHLFNRPENQDYVGPIPDKKYFAMDFAAKEQGDLDDFDKWYDEWEGDWNFKNELIKYCRNDVEMLADIVQQYDQIYFDSFGAHPFYYTTTPSAMQDVSLRQQRERMQIDRDMFDSDEAHAEAVDQLAQDEEWAVLKYAENQFARECLRGGKTEIRRVYYKLSPEEKARGCKIILQDICSQYPYQQVVHDFPVGVPLIMVWDYPAAYDSTMNVVYKEEQPTYEEMKNWRGFICCDIEPPSDLFHATLIENDTDRNKAISSLELKTRKHFVFDEVKAAIEQDGYVLKKVYRFDKYNYRESKWKELVLRCYLNKMKYSKNTPSIEDQQRLVQAYEERFDFGEQVRQSFSSWTKDDAKKLVFKIGTNSIWGKNAENPDRDNPAITIDCEEHLDQMNMIFLNINESKYKFVSMHKMGRMHQIITKTDMDDKTVYHKGYLPAAVCVPSYGRMQLNDALRILGDQVLMHDTDSVMYIYDPTNPCHNRIDEDDVLGGWEVENDKIEEFVGIAPKTYAYKCSDGYTVVKCKGLSIKNYQRNAVNFDSMKDLVMTYLNAKVIKTIDVPQQTFKYQKGIGMHTYKFLKQLRFNPTELKGKLDRRDGIIYPFGHVMCADIDLWEENWEYLNQPDSPVFSE